MAEHPRASVNLDVQAGRDPAPAAPLPDDPFHIALIGDFSGRAHRTADAPPLHARRARAVDRDDLDDVLAAFTPRLDLTLDEGTRVALSFREIDDFHADALFGRAPFFRSLREARQKLADPDSFGSALESILGAAPPPTDPGGADADDVVADVLGGGASLLDRMVGADDGARTDPLRSFLRRVVAPHVVPGSDPRREALLDDVDASIAAGLRAVLHHPAFQALEALWRGVNFLVRRLETDASLKLFLLDATPAELAAPDATTHLAAALRASAGGAAWSALVVDHAFRPADVALLRDLAALGVRLGAPILAGAHPSVAGFHVLSGLPDATDVHPADDDAWHAFRRSADAAFVGLVLPRMMLRLPYGDEGDACERLRAFEELDAPPSHEHFLWGNGAFAAALLLGQAFTQAGWRMRPGIHLDVPGLPVWNWRADHGPALVPAAECVMTDRLAEALLDTGPMVLATIRHGETARLVRFQSLADPPRALQGPWSRAT